jgi:DNA-binding MarR family transcriptional regulator
MHQLTREDYQNLLTFRIGLRRFQHWSQAQARAVGLTPAQHQLLLAIKGHRGQVSPAIGDLAGYLLLRPHSTVELVDRAETRGLVERWSDSDDGRLTRVRLTADGEKRLNQLAAAHLEELQRLAPVLDQLVAAAGAASADGAMPSPGTSASDDNPPDGPAGTQGPQPVTSQRPGE